MAGGWGTWNALYGPLRATGIPQGLPAGGTLVASRAPGQAPLRGSPGRDDGTMWRDRCRTRR